MATVHRFRWLCQVGCGIALAVATGATHLLAADPAAADAALAKHATATSSGAVEMFDAMHNGDLGVQFIPHNATEATLILTNNTDLPLNVHLPEAFAAVPVEAQFLQPPGGRNAQQQQTFGKPGAKPNQTLGTGTDQKNRAQVGFGGAVAKGQVAAQAAKGANAGAFSIPPERVVKLKLPTVCLEFGKAEPNAHVPYTVVPIESFTASGELQELCKMLGAGTVERQVAQAAAWHLSNHMSWEKLTDLKHFPHNSGFTKPVFTKDQIHAAEAVTDKLIKMTPAQPGAKSVGVN